MYYTFDLINNFNIFNNINFSYNILIFILFSLFLAISFDIAYGELPTKIHPVVLIGSVISFFKISRFQYNPMCSKRQPQIAQKTGQGSSKAPVFPRQSRRAVPVLAVCIGMTTIHF